jgi:hypothetical protein
MIAKKSIPPVLGKQDRGRRGFPLLALSYFLDPRDCERIFKK